VYAKELTMNSKGVKRDSQPMTDYRQPPIPRKALMGRPLRPADVGTYLFITSETPSDFLLMVEVRESRASGRKWPL